MTPQSGTNKTYEDKIRAELQQFDTRLQEFEARDKHRTAQAEIDAINHLKKRKQEIETRRQELRTASDARIQQVKSQIDTDLAKLKSSLDQLTTRLKKAG